MHDVKIFGERNTSTNALKKIIEQNSASRVFPSTAGAIDPALRQRLKPWRAVERVTQHIAPRFVGRRVEREIDRVFDGRGPELAWKHSATCFEDPGRLHGRIVIFCIRNPWSWFLSFYRNPYHSLSDIPARIEDFVDFDWRLVRRDNLPFDRLPPLRLYEEKLRSYVSFIKRHGKEGVDCRVVKFEDLILRQEEVWAGLRGVLKDPAETFAPLISSTKDRGKTIDFYRDYYGSERWRPEIEPLLPRLRAQVSPDLLAYFSYDV